MPYEHRVCHIAIGCLLRASSPSAPPMPVLWDCPAFQELLKELSKIARKGGYQEAYECVVVYLTQDRVEGKLSITGEHLVHRTFFQCTCTRG